MQIKTFLLTLLISLNVSAEIVEELKIKNVDINTLQIDKNFLKSWGIDEAEYRRFIYLKNNTPRGLMTPKANPLYYLGLEAKTDAQRRKYAEAIVRLEFSNVEKMQALNKEIMLAHHRIYGAGQAVDLRISESLKREMNPLANVLSQSDTALPKGRDLFVSIDCESCILTFNKLMTQLTSGAFESIDILFPLDTSDLEMKRWAYKAGVDRELNKRKVVNLRRVSVNDEIDSYPTIRISNL